MLGRLGAAAWVATGLGAGAASAGHDPDEPRIEFHRQTRRLDVDTRSVLVARADLPEGGFVMVHDEPASEGHHESTRLVDGVSGSAGRGNGGRTRSGGGNDGDATGGDHAGHDHRHDVFGITGYLDPGHYGGVAVPLETVPNPGTYGLVAMLHRDDGNEEFDGHGRDGHYRTDGSNLHVNADVRFVSPTGRSR